MTNCECTVPGWCARHGFTKSPHLFRLCRTHQVAFQTWERVREEDGQPERVLDGWRVCRHRGHEQVEQLPCELCGGRKRLVDIFPCDIHGECTETRLGTRSERARFLACCLSCETYAPRGEMTPTDSH